MIYSVKELSEKLEEKIGGLGIDSKFKENPAFASTLVEIKGLISQMSMFEAAETVIVKEEEGKIYFDWTSTDGERYSMSISSSSPETFRLIRTKEKKTFVDTIGQTMREKNVVEKVATLDRSGFITLTTNEAIVDDLGCDVGKCHNFTWSEKKCYTANGVMKEREYKEFSRGELTEDFDRASVDSILNIPRQAFEFGFLGDRYVRKTLLTREMLDTARIFSEDKTKGIRYIATLPLNQEHGLREMFLLSGYDQYPQDIVIPPLSQEQIEAMIQRESNPKVAEELRSYAVGRENYYYSSAEDRNFVSKGISQSQGMSR